MCRNYPKIISSNSFPLLSAHFLWFSPRWCVYDNLQLTSKVAASSLISPSLDFTEDVTKRPSLSFCINFVDRAHYALVMSSHLSLLNQQWFNHDISVCFSILPAIHHRLLRDNHRPVDWPLESSHGHILSNFCKWSAASLDAPNCACLHYQ